MVRLALRRYWINTMKKRILKRTLTFVGEGECEQGFLKYLRQIYRPSGLKVTPKTAGGKGPSNVLSTAIGTYQNSGCDKVAVLLDTDLMWPKDLIKDTERYGIIVIGSSPCLEGLFFKILGIKIPEPITDGKKCKQEFNKKFDIDLTDPCQYELIFSKEILDEASKDIIVLKTIIDTIKGKTF